MHVLKIVLQILIFSIFFYFLAVRVGNRSPLWKESSFKADMLNMLVGRKVYRESKVVKENNMALKTYEEGLKEGYVAGEMERIALATHNSDLKSDLRELLQETADQGFALGKAYLDRMTRERVLTPADEDLIKKLLENPKT